MNRLYALLTLAGLVGFVSAVPAEDDNRGDLMRFIRENLRWMGQSAFKISGDVIVYVDTTKPKDGEPADIILITHSHGDHCSPIAVKKLRKDSTAVFAPEGCLTRDYTAVKPGFKTTVKGVEIETVPAYNIDKNYHPKSSQWAGYILTVKGIRIYFAGDTDRIPEMKNLKADIAVLPVGGTYTMTVEEAVRAALDIKPKIAIPMHYGSIVGTPEDGERFKKLLDGKIEVMVMKAE
ncbi:MAG: MBL fold metallo-hydrolase [Bacillota bacterium]